MFQSGGRVIGPGLYGNTYSLQVCPSTEPSIAISGRAVVMTANSPYVFTIHSGETSEETAPTTGRSVRVNTSQIRSTPTGTTRKASAAATTVAARPGRGACCSTHD